MQTLWDENSLPVKLRAGALERLCMSSLVCLGGNCVCFDNLYLFLVGFSKDCLISNGIVT